MGLSLVSPVRAAATAPETIKNLNAAYQGESNANNRYTKFAAAADKEDYAQVARLFRAAAAAEAIHRDTHKAAIEKLGGNVETFQLDEVEVKSTADNLRAAIKGESYERDTMHPEFLETAKKECSSGKFVSRVKSGDALGKKLPGENRGRSPLWDCWDSSQLWGPEPLSKSGCRSPFPRPPPERQRIAPVPERFARSRIGNLPSNCVLKHELPGRTENLLEEHEEWGETTRNLAIAAAVVASAAALLGRFPMAARGAGVLAALLAIAAAFSVAQTGHAGGQLVYKHGIGLNTQAGTAENAGAEATATNPKKEKGHHKEDDD